ITKMIYTRGITTTSIFTILAAILLLTGHLLTDANPITLRSPGLESPHNHRGPDSRRHVPVTGAFEPRSDVTPREGRSLAKRGNCFSSGENTWRCSSQTPSVAECVTKIQSWGQVGSRISVFYNNLSGKDGLTECKNYFNCNANIGSVVLFDDIADHGWLDAQNAAIAKGKPGSNPNIVGDPFLKRLSQAFAEASKGDAYVCTPESSSPNNNFSQDYAWGGWEYPALTRNADVTKIIRVDPKTGVTRQIWKQGDSATPNAPKG
ncbi:MAG: hypothetical protein Q9169_008443, partial [Polycauliona sp. 2 TL-2023]